MPKHQDDFDLQLSPSDALKVCREAIADLDWRLLKQTDNYLVCKEQTSAVMWTWPATIEVFLKSNGPTSTTVILNGSNFGFGPIQRDHLVGQMGNLRNKVELLASEGGSSVGSRPASELTAELKNLAALHAEGVLTDEEFARAKAKLIGG